MLDLNYINAEQIQAYFKSLLTDFNSSQWHMYC